MFYLENNTTFSGADIKVYAYRSISDFTQTDKEKRKARRDTSLDDTAFSDDPFYNKSPLDMEEEVAKKLEGLASGRSKLLPRYEVTDSDGVSKIVDETERDAIVNRSKTPTSLGTSQDFDIVYSQGKKKTVQNPQDAIAEQQRFQIENARRLEEGEPLLPVPTIVPQAINEKILFGDGSTETLDADSAFDKISGWSEAEVKSSEPVLDVSSVSTNKVNQNYIDIVSKGSDKAALKIAREYQLAQQNAQRNKVFTKDTKQSFKKDKPIIEIGSLYSITYSSFREKNAIRTLGRVSAKGYTKGQRTIAGSMNFAVFQSHELMDFLKYTVDADGNRVPNNEIVLLDQLPSFNLMLVMVNEYGGASILHLFNVTISSESQQTSANDMALMNNVTFYAEDIMTVENVGNVWETSLSMLHPTILAGNTLKFYSGSTSTTLEKLLNSYSGSKAESGGSRIDQLISRSRGLF